jgi:putative effector of murein hydrolase LrgA (UPF0299 family)
MAASRLTSKIKIHDGIVGMIYLLSVLLAFYVDIQWIYLAGAVAVLQILSMFTGFCPVYFVIDKMMPEKTQQTTMD